MSEKKLAIKFGFYELMQIYFSVDMPLRRNVLLAALRLGDKWEQFDEYLPVTFHSCAEKEMFLKAALKFARNYRDCESICLWARNAATSIAGCAFVEKIVEKMVTFAKTPEHWRMVESCSSKGSGLEAKAKAKLGKLPKCWGIPDHLSCNK
jgi:hypothetical protein